MVDDNVDGYNILPVVVEDTNYLMRRERNSRKYNQSLRLQLANEYDTINITAAEYPIPGPDPCDYYNVFGQTSGTTQVYLNGVVGDAAHIKVVNATKDRYVVIAVNNILGETPVAGQTYYIRVDYDFTTPVSPIRQGNIQLGNTTTGGGSVILLGGLQTPGTPIIVNAVWGTPISGVTNTFRLVLPGYTGGGLMNGNMYITVGFGNCP